MRPESRSGKLVIYTIIGLIIGWTLSESYPIPGPMVVDKDGRGVRPVTVVPGIHNFGKDYNPLKLRPTPEAEGWQKVRRFYDSLGRFIDQTTDAGICGLMNLRQKSDPECE